MIKNIITKMSQAIPCNLCNKDCNDKTKEKK